MKKKGLIISTIVMVVVLIASLTTATYAWFTSSASATIDQISLNANAADGLLIGAKGAASPSDYSGYRTGTVQWDGTNGYWSSEESGFGQAVHMTTVPLSGGDAAAMSISATKAVSYTTDAITATSGGDDISANSWYKANGNGATRDNGTLAAALKQYDYADLELGVTAAKDNSVKQAWMTIAVTLPNSQTKLGMAAAIHLIVYVNDVVVVGDGSFGTGEQASVYTITSGEGTSDYKGLSAYPGKSYTNNYSGDVTLGTFYSAQGTTLDGHTIPANGWTYVVPLHNSNTTLVSMTGIIKVRVIAWIEGTDDACVVANAGTGGNINLYFDYTEKYNETGAYTFNNGVMSAYNAG